MHRSCSQTTDEIVIGAKLQDGFEVFEPGVSANHTVCCCLHTFVKEQIPVAHRGPDIDQRQDGNHRHPTQKVYEILNKESWEPSLLHCNKKDGQHIQGRHAELQLQDIACCKGRGGISDFNSKLHRSIQWCVEGQTIARPQGNRDKRAQRIDQTILRWFQVRISLVIQHAPQVVKHIVRQSPSSAHIPESNSSSTAPHMRLPNNLMMPQMMPRPSRLKSRPVISTLELQSIAFQSGFSIPPKKVDPQKNDQGR